MKWLRYRLPQRENVLAYRFMRPFAHYLGDPNIWHFNRHSVARGAALGLFFGLSIPFGQIPLAALLAVPLRANLAAATLFTFVSNPFTTPVIYFGAYEVGRWLLPAGDSGAATAVSPDGWVDGAMAWLAGASVPTITGLSLCAVTGALLGYGLIHLIWRFWVSRRWTNRRQRPAPEAS